MFLIFFEKTISGSGDSEALARGVKWVGMVGELSMISIGPLDQVVAIQEDSKHDRSIVIRTGISSSDLSGKTWKIVSAAISLDFQVRNWTSKLI